MFKNIILWSFVFCLIAACNENKKEQKVSEISLPDEFSSSAKIVSISLKFNTIKAESISIKKEDFSKITSLLRNHHIDGQPVKRNLYMFLKMIDENGDSHTVSFYKSPKKESAFRVDDEYYLGASRKKVEKLYNTLSIKYKK